MNFIRGSLLVFVSVLLFTSFFLLGTFATLNNSLEYEIVKPQINSLIKDIVETEVNRTVIDEQVKILQTHCQNNTEYVFDDAETNHTFSIPCGTIAQGTDSIINEEVNSLTDGYYHKKYSCKFWKCIKESPLVLISQHANDYWKYKYYTFLLISILLAALLFLLVEKKNNFPIIAGILLSVSFIPVALLDSIGRAIIKIVLSGAGLALENLRDINLKVIVAIFFSKANSVFLTGFIIGLVLIAIGIFLKLLKIGFKIEHWFEKKGKEE